MNASTEMQVARHRVFMASLGGIAALALWLLAENWDNPALPPALYLALFTFVGTYSGVALALAGPVSSGRALRGALAIALPVTALVSLAGLGQVVATDFLDEPVMLSVIVVLVFFSTPFLLVWLQSPGDWRHYPSLFDAAWTMLVRYGLAIVFVVVFWLVIFLSNALLRLVGVDFIERLLRADWAIFGLSGAVLGLGLAVVYELRAKISPFPILRLLRLLVPVVFLVLLVFVLAIPFRGLSDLFGEISAAATLMGSAIVAISLISTALDRDDAAAVRTRGIRGATRLLTLLLPPLAGLAAWAVFLRVRQYGWTPDRVLAMAAAVFVLTYGLGYAGAVLRGHGWSGRIRQVNVAMALIVIVASALWLTPVLDPFRISAASQVARYEAGRSDLDQLPIWALQHEWGKPGRRALERLETMTGRPDSEELLARIADARSLRSRYKFTRAAEDRRQPESVADLLRLMAVRPAGASLPANAFDDLAYYRLSRWLEGCKRPLPDGRPGCVFIRGPFSPTADGAAQGMILYLDSTGRVQANHLVFRDGGEMEVTDVLDPVAGNWGDLPAQAIARALDGDFDIRPSGTNALFIGDAVLVPGN